MKTQAQSQGSVDMEDTKGKLLPARYRRRYEIEDVDRKKTQCFTWHVVADWAAEQNESRGFLTVRDRPSGYHEENAERQIQDGIRAAWTCTTAVHEKTRLADKVASCFAEFRRPDGI